MGEAQGSGSPLFERESADASWRASLPLPAHAGTPRAARRLVTTLFIAWGVDDHVERAELITSELVSFVVSHRPVAELALQITGDHEEICIMVVAHPDRRADRAGQGADDADGDDAVDGDAVVHATSTLGNPAFFLIDHLASDWGMDEHRFGTRLWARISLTDPD